jgi:hypothetical protein
LSVVGFEGRASNLHCYTADNVDTKDAFSLAVSDGGPLIGLVDEDGTVHYYCREEDVERALSASAKAGAPALAGVWSDLEWDEMQRQLDRIRHDALQSPTA